MGVSFLIMAAGSSTRMGGPPKQCRKLAGLPLWQWSARIAEQLYSEGVVNELILVVPDDLQIEFPNSLQIPRRRILGGKTRAESVLNALEISNEKWVLIHDAARPFIDRVLCLELVAAASQYGAAVPLLPSVDSIKIKNGECKLSSIPRDQVYRAQTPQVFETAELISAMSAYGLMATDEAECWCAAGKAVGIVDGREKNFKITTQYDWEVALALQGAPSRFRVGHGYDVHPLVPGRPLILGGVTIASPLGLDGHSDADIVCHSVADALLGAAGEPDIGTLFPAEDMKYKNADSTKIMIQSIERILIRGMKINWIDITLQAQVPKLGIHVPDIKAHLEALFLRSGVAPCINLKVKSGEHVGATGRGECMICHVVATVEETNDAQS